jgi:hypothetical protein
VNGLVKKMPALLTSMSTTLKRASAVSDDHGGSGRLSDVTIHQSNLVGSDDVSGLRYLPRIGNDVEAPLDEPFHDCRADSLRSSGHDGCLAWAAHGRLPRCIGPEDENPVPIQGADWAAALQIFLERHLRLHQQAGRKYGHF